MSRTKIERLTAEQAESLKCWHAEYLAIGTSTEPADRPRAEAAITEMYRLIGESAPRYVWCDSPATCLLAISALRSGHHRELASLRASLRASLGASLWDSLGASLRDSLGASLWDSLGASLRASLRASLGASLRASLRASLGASLRASLWASLWDSLWDSLGASLRASLWDSLWDWRFWGQHDAQWIAYYRFSEYIGVQYDAAKSGQLRLWDEIARSAGWWWPYKGLVVISERPSAVKMEPARQPNSYRLHCADGPALAFRDDYSVYVIHGVRVNEQIVMHPETLTVKQIQDEPNAETKRVMLERFGYERYIKESGATMVHRDDWGTLWRSEIENDEPLVMVQVVNSTPEPDGSFKEYMLRVPATMQRAKEAVAWTFGMTEQEYNPMVQT